MRNGVKILIIAQYFPPDITAAAFRIFDTARLLEANGHEVHVITALPHRSQADGDSVAEYDRQISRVLRTRVTHLNGGGFLNYIRHYVSFMVGSAWLGVKHRLAHWKPDVIWASSPPLFVGLSGVVLSRLFRIPLVVDIRDIWPASAVGAGQLSAGGRAYRIGERMEQYVYHQATHITCVARPMQEYIRAKTRTSVTIVYNGAKASDIADGPDGHHGPSNDHTLLYAGNLGRVQQLDLLIRAWTSVHGRNGHSKWIMKLLGTGAAEDDLKKLAKDLGATDSIVFLPPVSRQNAAREMAQAAALSVNLRPDKTFERTIPSKVFDCMAAGRPILAGVSGEGREILESTGANICYQPGNQQDLEQALEQLMRDYQRLQLLAYRNPQVIRNGYTRERAVEALMRVFDSAVPNRSFVPAMGADDQWQYRRLASQFSRENSLKSGADERLPERKPAHTYKSSPGQARKQAPLGDEIPISDRQ
ncbi:MAG: glycosyltransferase WbuB [Planctomycetaceae bacterium]|nr:MAG: glycosyltransferase WbuB [Planctomycetaceae bacterium]